jgi:hypothetical protein
MNLINTQIYNGYPVLYQYAPLIEHILIGNEKVLAQALMKYKRLVVMRFDLKFPANYIGDVHIISKLFDSLRWKINNDLSKKTENKGRKVHSDIDYIWVKELSSKGGWHYHVALILNRDVYNTFGLITSTNNNMYHRIFTSWASAIGCSLEGAAGLVELPPNNVYHLNQNCSSFNATLNAVKFRLSYFAKLETKPYGNGSKVRFYSTSGSRGI